MPRATAPTTQFVHVSELVDYLGVPPRRIRLIPTPGTANVKDVIRLLDHENIPCELIDAILVEKDMGVESSYVAAELLRHLGNHIAEDDSGFLLGADGALEIFTDRVRIPDCCFVSWDRCPGRTIPVEPVPELAPDLAVEVLSEGNTPKEMKQKRADYFKAGVRLVWLIAPEKRSIEVYTSPEAPDTTLTEDDTLDGGKVLPGFSLPLSTLFAKLKKSPTGTKRDNTEK